VARLVDDSGRALAAWIVGLALEHLFVGISRRDELSGAWELWPARTAGAPIFLGAALLVALACAAVAELLRRENRRPVQALAVAAAMAVGWGVGTGRHFANPAMRGAFAIAVGLLGLAVEYTYHAVRTRAPRALPGALASAAAVAWWADGHVLPRLYPAFHWGLFALSLAASGLAAIELCILGWRVTRALVVLAAGCAVYAPFASRRLRSYDNLRRVLVEAAPWMGRAVRVAAVLAPREPVAEGALTSAPTAAARALDWSGRDIVLISIDALRADHLGAYGYARPTTPNIDALAKEGTLFHDAYCPTPHTSYSVTSMMTGKYMRPLLALGLGRDSETLASDLRRYGFRTAAFYPPAVFFIDEPKFDTFESRALDFEYRKVEFADPTLREKQLREYLQNAHSDKPLFLWVHFFEPHEPYVQHPEHVFGDTDVDAYDSEIATADDGVGRVVAAVREKRPGAVVIVTADHGEEFGDHGGRYHGTSVYEEQVRVPLVVVGPGVRAGAVDVPVQTIDLVPTVLSALGIPRPARVRGRDLGPLLAKPAAPNEKGFAFAETDDASLLAKGALRLVCQKQVDACALFDVTSDRAERHDVTRDHEQDARAMRGELDGIERSHGKFEGQGAALPEALRRGAAGDAAAAVEVAGLLDDVNVEYRREAARVLFDLRSADTAAQLRRACDHDDDAEARAAACAAAVRVDPSEPASKASALLASSDEGSRRLAALALAERGDASGEAELAKWAVDPGVEFSRQREIALAIGTAKARAAEPVLVRWLDDVRLRGYAADALGALGDPAAKPELLSHFEAERYVSVRPREAAALLPLGAGRELEPVLARYAGLPEPMDGAIDFARRAGVLDAAHSGSVDAGAHLRAPSAGPLRVGVLLRDSADVTLEVDGAAVPTRGTGRERWGDLPSHGATVAVTATSAGGVEGIWLVGVTGRDGGF
jgi:arylsulfatase A-like enzyme